MKYILGVQNGIVLEKTSSWKLLTKRSHYVRLHVRLVDREGQRGEKKVKTACEYATEAAEARSRCNSPMSVGFAIYP